MKWNTGSRPVNLQSSVPFSIMSYFWVPSFHPARPTSGSHSFGVTAIARAETLLATPGTSTSHWLGVDSVSRLAGVALTVNDRCWKRLHGLRKRWTQLFGRVKIWVMPYLERILGSIVFHNYTCVRWSTLRQSISGWSRINGPNHSEQYPVFTRQNYIFCSNVCTLK